MTEQKYKVFADWSAFVAIITAEKRLPNKDTLIRSAGAIVSTSHTDAILKKNVFNANRYILQFMFQVYLPMRKPPL